MCFRVNHPSCYRTWLWKVNVSHFILRKSTEQLQNIISWKIEKGESRWTNSHWQDGLCIFHRNVFLYMDTLRISNISLWKIGALFLHPMTYRGMTKRWSWCTKDWLYCSISLFLDQRLVMLVVLMTGIYSRKQSLLFHTDFVHTNIVQISTL